MAMTILVFSVPFILFERQCRYFPLLSLLAVVMNFLVLAMVQKRNYPIVLFPLVSLLFFHTNHFNYIWFAAVLFLAGFFCFPQKDFRIRLIMAHIITGIIILPSFGHYLIFDQSGKLDFYGFPSTVEQCLSDVFTYFLPLPVLLLLLVIVYRRLRTHSAEPDTDSQIVAFLLIQPFLYTLTLGISPQYFTRYLVAYIPTFAVLCAAAIMYVVRYTRVAGITMGVCIVFTNWLNLYPMQALGIDNDEGTVSRYSLPFPNIPLLLYAHELTTPSYGPDEGLVDFFAKRNNPEETIMITYGALPLIFYTDFRVIDGMRGGSLPKNLKPDWLVIRRDKRFWTYPTTEELVVDRFIDENLDLKDYEALEIPYADHMHGNRSDPRIHQFYNDVHPGNMLTIYHRKPKAGVR